MLVCERLPNYQALSIRSLKFVTIQNAKASERAKAAETLINRAIGPAEAPNSIPFPTDQTSLVEAIDAIKEGLSPGACSEFFAKTMVTVLGAQVQAQKLEDMVACAGAHDQLQRRPVMGHPQPTQPASHVNGTVVTLPVKPWPHAEQSPPTHCPVA